MHHTHTSFRPSLITPAQSVIEYIARDLFSRQFFPEDCRTFALFVESKKPFSQRFPQLFAPTLSEHPVKFPNIPVSATYTVFLYRGDFNTSLPRIKYWTDETATVYDVLEDYSITKLIRLRTMIPAPDPHPDESWPSMRKPFKVACYTPIGGDEYIATHMCPREISSQTELLELISGRLPLRLFMKVVDFFKQEQGTPPMPVKITDRQSVDIIHLLDLILHFEADLEAKERAYALRLTEPK